MRFRKFLFYSCVFAILMLFFTKEVKTMTISDIKDLIKNRRVELGLTLKDVAQAVGVSEGTVSRWESGNITNMKRNKIAALAKVLRISPTIIMGWNESVVSEDNSCYYLNPEAAKMAQEIYDNPQYKVLFDATKKLKPESIKEVMKFIDYQKAKEEGDLNE